MKKKVVRCYDESRVHSNRCAKALGANARVIDYL